jgi:hypothetical protein
MSRRRIVGRLPPDAEAILKAAAQVGTSGSIERTRAVEDAYRKTEELYPSLFQQEYLNMKVMLTDTRVAFADAIFEPKTVNGEGKPAYSITALLDPVKHKKVIAEVEAAIEEVARAKWGAKADGVLKQLRASDKTALHDGDTKAQYDGFEGMMFVSSRSNTRPLVIDRDKSPLVSSDGKPYAGCYCNVQVELWAQDNGFGKRVNAQLKGVQFVRDGDAFAGGAPADADDFGSLDDGNDADDLA